MKDYYYILGIKQTAGIDEIKKAHKKLSLKFHPDVNDGDPFFTERFKEIQEAYETLRDSVKRQEYDRKLSSKNSGTNTQSGYNFNPTIEFFKSSKADFEYDDEVVFSWKTVNANKVTIKPFGEVQPIGQKAFKIKNFKKPNLAFELIAENTYINKQIVQSISLVNRTYIDLYAFFKEIYLKEENNKKDNQNAKSENKQFTETVYRKTIDGNTLQISSKNNQTIGARVLINGKNAADGIYIYQSLTHKLVIKNGEIVQRYFLEVKDKIIYEKKNENNPSIGDKVYDLAWNKVKDGKYKYSFIVWYNVKNGIIV